ncbi:hypothetical protein CFC21_035443 [Triticum aestivum]|uniref:Uncharacterized protein n=3 Tax=Triticum TaxID=4564 RepID=A0A9R0VJT8_TRITD|nr:hypothetical protein CFC21_035443 [Triticum aestivum]VAH61646.1 unnamed protein product [Triticum turgidum subsp. durum]
MVVVHVSKVNLTNTKPFRVVVVLRVFGLDGSDASGRSATSSFSESVVVLGVPVVELAGLGVQHKTMPGASGCQQQGGDGGGQPHEMVGSLSGGRPTRRWLGLAAEANHARGCAGARSTLEASEAEEVERAAGEQMQGRHGGAWWWLRAPAQGKERVAWWWCWLPTGATPVEARIYREKMNINGGVKNGTCQKKEREGEVVMSEGGKMMP